MNSNKENDKTKEMNMEEAYKILNIQTSCCSQDSIRKAYLKMALKWHPDKPNGDAEKFKEIKQAYDYLLFNMDEKIPLPRNVKHSANNIKYSDILKEFISYLSPETQWDNLFFETSFSEFTKKSAIHMGEKISLKIFKSLDLKHSIEMFEIIHKWNGMFNIDDKLLKTIEKELKEKMNSNNIIVINPTIKDLLNDNIYKYDFGDDVIYIPLWHKKIYHKLNDNMIVFLITPDISVIYTPNNKENVVLTNLENLEIKDNNDIHANINIKLSLLFEKGYIHFGLGEKIYKIDSKQLLINKEPQIIVYKNKGLLKMNKNNIYCTERRASIYIEVNLY
jgi:hypothetical protein